MQTLKFLEQQLHDAHQSAETANHNLKEEHSKRIAAEEKIVSLSKKVEELEKSC